MQPLPSGRFAPCILPPAARASAVLRACPRLASRAAGAKRCRDPYPAHMRGWTDSARWPGAACCSTRTASCAASRGRGVQGLPIGRRLTTPRPSPEPGRPSDERAGIQIPTRCPLPPRRAAPARARARARHGRVAAPRRWALLRARDSGRRFGTCWLRFLASLFFRFRSTIAAFAFASLPMTPACVDAQQPGDVAFTLNVKGSSSKVRGCIYHEQLFRA